jgi:glycosyl-4,4'-diaponeurosporenoate acyltransferase
MRLIHLPSFWTVLLDIVIWFVLHIGIVSIALRIPARLFRPQGFFFRQRSFENDGEFYLNYFNIKRWKRYAPDGANFSKERGFPKKKLNETGNRYLYKFFIETCRAETAHWMLIGVAPFFFLWNRFWVGWFMILYAVAQNLPLVMIQRYNRIRFRRILHQKGITV